MKELDNRLKAAFDTVHAEETLKASARAYVRKKTGRKIIGGRYRPVTVLACMMLVFFCGYFSRMYFEPVSIISIDINPSIELGINTFDHVVSVEAFNEDGRELTDRLQLRFLNYEEAVDRIVTSETVTALRNKEEELVIAVVGEDENRNAKLCESLESYTESGSSGYCYMASPETVEHAHSCGMSYGKYLVYQEALKQDATLTAEQTQDMTMKEIREIAEETCPTESLCEETEHHPENVDQNHGHKEKKHKNGHH